MGRKRMKLTTNRGALFDLRLNTKVNFLLWLNHIDDDEEAAVELTAKVIEKYQ